MAYPAGPEAGPNLKADLSAILPYRTTLKNGQTVILDRAVRCRSDGPLGHLISNETLESMHDLLNYEITAGNTYPFDHVMTMKHFLNYFFAYDVFYLRVCEAEQIVVANAPNPHPLRDSRLVGCFYIKPNFPGRSSHICNAGFLVAPAYRGLGAGRIMGERFRHLAKALGYRGAMYNLVYETNVASNKLWEPLGFEQIGRVPNVGRLKKSPDSNEEHYVDARMWYFDATKSVEHLPAPWEKYPRVIPRQLESRL